MYNDRNDRSNRSIMSQRVPYGRSCPALAQIENREKNDLPEFETNHGERGFERQNHSKAPSQNQMGWGLSDHPLAMVYSPYHLFRDIYAPEAALKRGTLFAELDLPFEGDKRKTGGFC